MRRTGSEPRAFLLAAGLGLRARPLSEARPKALFPVAGAPALHLHLASLRAAGFGRIGINLLRGAVEIERALAPLASRGLAIRAFPEEEPLGTGGGLLNARSFLGRSPVLVRNADVVLAADLRGLLRAHEAHRRRGVLATLLLAERAPLEVFGGFAVDSKGRIAAHVPRGDSPPRGTRGFVYASAALVESRILDRLERAGPRPDLVRDGILPALAGGEDVRAVVTRGLFGHLGTPADYLGTVLAVLRGGLPRHVIGEARRLAGAEGGRWERGKRRWIAPGALVEPGARIGESVAIEAGARIAAGASVERSVVWEGVNLGEGEHLREAIAFRTGRAWTRLPTVRPLAAAPSPAAGRG